MQLKFHAREDQLVRVPFIVPAIGQPTLYVGRRFDALTRGYPATTEPYEVDADTDSGRRLAELCRRDACLWPADEATAAACGVAFVEVEHHAGVWGRKAQTVVSGSGSSGSSDATEAGDDDDSNEKSIETTNSVPPEGSES